MTSDGSRVPSAIDAERVVLGSLMIQPDLIDEVAPLLATGDFYGPNHGAIYAAITANAALNEPTDQTAIALSLARTGELTRMQGGATYLHECVTAVPTAAQGVWYARKVAEASYARRIEAAAARLHHAATSGDPDAIAVARALLEQEQAGAEGRTPTGRQVASVSASSMKMKATKWLYQGRIPSGAITLLAGREGIGKSTLAFDVAAQLTRGELPGRYYGIPSNVGIVASEDSWECVILPRLVAARADLSRVHRIEAVESGGEYETISAPNDLLRLRAVVADLKIRLLLVDPIMSVISGGLDTHKDREVRQALDPLSRFAAETRVGVLGLIHVNKSSTTDPLNSVMASRAFTAVARSVLYCILDPECEREDRYLFGHPKCNVGAKQPTIGYHIIECKIELDPAEVDDGDDAVVVTSKVVWGDVDTRSIREAMEGPPAERAKGEVNGSLLGWIADQKRVVGRAEIVAQFPEIKPATLDKNLGRMVERGQLARPFAGHYKLPEEG